MPKRLFIALPLPVPVKAELNALIQIGQRQAPPVRWVRPEQMHVTLKFLGDVEEQREERLTAALEAVTGISPFVFNLAGVGAFPNRQRPRVVWTGIDSGCREVAALAARVDEALAPCGFPREERPFSPHVTIGRVKQPGEFAGFWQAVDAAPYVGQPVDACEVKLVHSTLTPKGPLYADLAAFPLRGKRD